MTKTNASATQVPTKNYCPGDPKAGHNFASTYDGKRFIFFCGNCPYSERASDSVNRRMEFNELGISKGKSGSRDWDAGE